MVRMRMMMMISGNKFCFRHFEMEIFVSHSGGEGKKFL